MAPGPLLTVVIGDTAQRGFVVALLLVMGHALADFVGVLTLTIGLARAMEQPVVIAIVGSLGGAFLIGMGYSMAQGAWKGIASFQLGTHDHTRSLVPVAVGFGVSVSNPYFTLWWVTIGAAFIARSISMGATGIISFYLGHILSDLAWYGFVGSLIVSGRGFLGQRVYRYLILACGGFLVVLGGSFVFWALHLLTSA